MQYSFRQNTFPCSLNYTLIQALPAANRAAAPIAPVRRGAYAPAVEEAEEAPATVDAPATVVGAATPEVKGTLDALEAPENATV